jgi:hypothetical protein
VLTRTSVGRITGALACALGLSCFISTARAADIAAQIAGHAPTPCLDAVAPLETSEFLQKAARTFVDAVGRGGQLSASWAPGNQYYDRAIGMALDAWHGDQRLQAILWEVSARLALQTIFQQAAPDELTYLDAFFRTPQGQVFWTYMVDGAHCAGLFQGLSTRQAVLTTTQSQLASDWQARLAMTKQEFGAAFAPLSAEQKSDFGRASKLFTRLSRYDESVPPQLRPFAAQLQSAMAQSVASVSPQVTALASQFRATHQPP